MKTIILPHDHGNLPNNLQELMPSGNSFDLIADLFKIISDSKRLHLFWILLHCEECLINLSALLNISSSALLHHIKILNNNGLIESRRCGKEVYYTASKTDKSLLIHNMIEGIAEINCPVNIDSQKDDNGSNIEIIQRIHDYVIENISKKITIEDLSLKFHINQTTLKDVFKTAYRYPIATYIRNYRINKAKELLINTNHSISEIALFVGYDNQSKFSEVFKKNTGVLPKDFRKKN